MGWIRNEWILDPATGEWAQDRSRLCIIAQKTSMAAIEQCQSLWIDREWIIGKNLIIGMPNDPTQGNYLVVFHKEN